LGELDEATSLYRDLAAESSDAEVLAELAEILLSQGYSEEAQQALQESLELDAQQWKALYMRSMMLIRSGDESAARGVLEQVVELRPDFPQAHHDLGVIHAHGGDAARAVASYRRAIELAPSARSYNGLGTVYARAGKWQAAVQHFNKAIEIQSNYPTAYENLAQAYLAMGRSEQAEATMRRLEQLKDGTSR
jgi:Flp pilus assembly protein TadD